MSKKHSVHILVKNNAFGTNKLYWHRITIDFDFVKNAVSESYNKMRHAYI